ncbi:MAG: hypothetical protein GF401_00590 [Chitinivibrionales bacterium]|nr:hypothetical protein [Chitinivibrionales bacterium]
MERKIIKLLFLVSAISLTFWGCVDDNPTGPSAGGIVGRWRTDYQDPEYPDCDTITRTLIFDSDNTFEIEMYCKYSYFYSGPDDNGGTREMDLLITEGTYSAGKDMITLTVTDKYYADFDNHTRTLVSGGSNTSSYNFSLNSSKSQLTFNGRVYDKSEF